MANLESLFFYIICFAVAGFHFSFYKYQNIALRVYGLFISILIPSLVAGLRYNVGGDFPKYDHLFTRIRDSNWIQLYIDFPNTEYGFKALVKILSYCGNNSFVFTLISFFTLLFFILSLIKFYKNRNIVTTYVLFLFCYFPISFNAVRQFISLTIIFYGLQYIFKRKLLMYLLWCFFASLFHVSALFSIPIYFMWSNIRKSINNNFIFSIVLIIFFVFFYIYNRDYINFISLFSFDSLEKFEYIFETTLSMKNRDIYLKLLLLVIFFIIIKRLKFLDDRLLFFAMIYMFVVIIGFTGFTLPYFKRITLYFELPSTLIIASIPDIRIIHSKLIAYMFCYCYAVFYFILIYFLIGAANIFPYTARFF